MLYLLILIAAACTGVAFYNLICAFKDIPTVRASRIMLNGTREHDSGNQNLFHVYLDKAANALSPLLHLDNVKREKLALTLSIAGIDMTPETYTMKALLSALLTFFAGLFFCLLVPLTGFMIMALSILVWFAMYQKAFDTVTKKKKLIERELPRFATSLQQSLTLDRDVLKMLVSYRRIAGPYLSQELDTTIADMRTGNYESALLRFQNRVGSNMLSDIIRGLIGTLRGDDQQMYFKMLVFDMRQVEQSMLRKEAQKRPKQMQKYSMLMLLCILLIYVVVLSVQVIESVGVLF